MATANDAIGLGMPPALARIVMHHAENAVVASGAAIASATAVPGGNRYILVTASNAGNGIALPAVSGDINAGAQRADQIMVQNILSAAIVVYIPNTAQGSVTTIYMDGGSIVGTTGVSVAQGKPIILVPITVSTWIGSRSA